MEAIDMAISPYAMADPRSFGGNHFDKRTVCAGNIGPNKNPCMDRREKAKPSGKVVEDGDTLEFEKSSARGSIVQPVARPMRAMVIAVFVPPGRYRKKSPPKACVTMFPTDGAAISWACWLLSIVANSLHIKTDRTATV